MKNSPFIHPLPEKHEQEITTWFLFSTVLAISIFITLTFITLHQFTKVQKLKKQRLARVPELALFETTVQKLTDVKKEHEKLQNHLTTLEDISKTPKIISDQLDEISSIIPEDMYLETFNTTNTGVIQMSGHAQKSESITSFLAKLTSSEKFNTIKLTLLQKQKGNKALPFYFKLSNSL